MGKDECARHQREITVLEQIDKNVRTLMKTVSGINGRVRKTETESAAQRVDIDNNKDGIKGIQKRIWGVVMTIIASLSAWVIKVWAEK